MEKFEGRKNLEGKPTPELSNCLKYRHLKLKESFGKITPEEFDQLLELEFQKHLKENPPIGKRFSPEEELTRVRGLQGRERKEVLEIFKKNLTTQRKAWALCRVLIEKSIEFNPDVSKEKLMEIVYKFRAFYGFPENQIKIAEELIDKYYESRQRALMLRKQYPDDYDLVKELTGMSLDRNTSKIKVSVGPMMIIIEADRITTGKLYEKSENPKFGFKYSGFATESGGENSAYYVVINMDRQIRALSRDFRGKATKKHEYQHIKNKLFEEIFEKQEPLPLLSISYIEEKDPEVKKIILKSFFKEHRRRALQRVKDEILARLSSTSLNELQKQLEELFFKQDGGPYDFLAYLRDWEMFKNDPIYQEIAQKMLVEGYKKIIEKAVGSFRKLITEGKYSTQFAIALLADKPLIEWPKAVERLLKE